MKKNILAASTVLLSFLVSGCQSVYDPSNTPEANLAFNKATRVPAGERSIGITPVPAIGALIDLRETVIRGLMGIIVVNLSRKCI